GVCRRGGGDGNLCGSLAMSRMTAAKCFIVAMAIAGIGAPVRGQALMGSDSKKTTVKKPAPKKTDAPAKAKARTPKKVTKTSKPATPQPATNKPGPGKPAIPVATSQPADKGGSTETGATPVVQTTSPMANEQVAVQT